MSPGPFGPPPSQYMNRYKRCLVSLADGSMIPVCVDRYLRADNSGNPPVRNGRNAYHELIKALSDKTGTSRHSESYSLDGRRVHRDCFRMPFIGKGSPFDIGQAVLAASWCGLINARTVQRYCEDYMGLDCNGFASNLFRLDRNTSVGSYDDRMKRLAAAEEIGTRTVLVWVKSPGSGKTHTHVAVVERVDRIDANRKVVDLQIVHSEGGRGLNQKRFLKPFEVDEEGHLFFAQKESVAALSTQERIYALPPPNNSIPRD